VDVESTTACPGWVGTDILRSSRDGLPSRIFRSLAFPADGYGLASILRAMFDVQDGDGTVHDFYVNTALMKAGPALDRLFRSFPKWTYTWLPVRDVTLFVGSLVILQWQRVFPVVDTTPSSMASYDTTLQDALYQWSHQAVEEWLQ
jgi:hypothetical protein